MAFETAFTMDTSSIKYGPGVTREVGHDMKELGTRRVMVVTDSLVAIPPTFRVDITESIDLIEEVARLRGYDSIAETLPAISPLPPARDRARAMDRLIRNSLTRQGYNEIMTYSFIAPADLAGLNLPEDDYRRKPLALLNPLTEEQSCMRTTLIPGLLSAAQKNINQKNLHLKLFETGPVFLPEAQKKLPREEKTVAGLLTGFSQEETWNSTAREVDFFDIKGCMETLLRELAIDGFSFAPSPQSPFLRPGRALDLLLDAQRAGCAGELHPAVAERYGFSQKIYLFEISLAHLLSRAAESFEPAPAVQSRAPGLSVISEQIRWRAGSSGGRHSSLGCAAL